MDAKDAEVTRKTIAEWARQAYEQSAAKGWHDHPLLEIGEPDVERVLSKLALVHTEVSEAVEEARDQQWGIRWERDKYGQEKPEGFVVELADAAIRIMDTAEALGLPLEEAVRVKLEFNSKRAHRHGGRSA